MLKGLAFPVCICPSKSHVDSIWCCHQAKSMRTHELLVATRLCDSRYFVGAFSKSFRCFHITIRSAGLDYIRAAVCSGEEDGDWCDWWCTGGRPGSVSTRSTPTSAPVWGDSATIPSSLTLASVWGATVPLVVRWVRGRPGQTNDSPDWAACFVATKSPFKSRRRQAGVVSLWAVIVCCVVRPVCVVPRSSL